MNYHLKLSALWADVKERIKETNINITDEDLDYEPGQEERLIKALSKKIGKDEQHTKDWIESVAFTKDIAS